MPKRERRGVDQSLLTELDDCLADLPFPAAKEEVLAQVAGSARLTRLVEAMPGRTFTFRCDLLSTARVSLEHHLFKPWPEHARPGGYPINERLCAHLQQRLLLCRGCHGHLIRVVLRDGVVHLEGRTPDVTGGVLATRAALALTPGGRVVNLLDVQA